MDALLVYLGLLPVDRDEAICCVNVRKNSKQWMTSSTGNTTCRCFPVTQMNIHPPTPFSRLVETPSTLGYMYSSPSRKKGRPQDSWFYIISPRCFSAVGFVPGAWCLFPFAAHAPLLDVVSQSPTNNVKAPTAWCGIGQATECEGQRRQLGIRWFRNCSPRTTAAKTSATTTTTATATP